jgi:hypothetical protein
MGSTIVKKTVGVFLPHPGVSEWKLLNETPTFLRCWHKPRPYETRKIFRIAFVLYDQFDNIEEIGTVACAREIKSENAIVAQSTEDTPKQRSVVFYPV